jgi:hypothetical protein
MRARRQNHLPHLAEVAALIWNHSVAVHRTCYRLYGKHLPKALLQAHLAALEHRRFSHWANLNPQAVQQVADPIEAGYQLLFAAH